jgi:hypothetical protein
MRTQPHGFGNLPPREPRARTAGSRIGARKTITLRNEAERLAAVHTPGGQRSEAFSANPHQTYSKNLRQDVLVTAELTLVGTPCVEHSRNRRR